MLNNTKSVFQNQTTLELPNLDRIWDYGFSSKVFTFLSAPNLLSIGNRAFENSKLSSLTLPNVRRIGKECFKNSIFETIILYVIEKIGDRAFNLKNVSTTRVILPKKFNSPKELKRIFGTPIDKVTFIWV